MKDIVIAALAPLTDALNNIADAIRGSNGATPTVEVVAPAKAAKAAKAAAPAATPAKAAAPKPPTRTLEELVTLAQKVLDADKANVAPKLKAYNAANGIEKVSKCPPEKIAGLYAFFESLSGESVMLPQDEDDGDI